MSNNPTDALRKDILDTSQSTPVLVQFFAKWCGPCQILKPVLQKLDEQNDGTWQLRFVDVESHPWLATEYNIRTVPTVILFHEGRDIAQFVGSKSGYVVRKWLKNNLPQDIEKSPMPDLEELLRKGDIKNAKSGILNTLAEKYHDEPLIHLLKAIFNLGNNNKQARTEVETVDNSGPLGTIVDKIRDLIDLDEDEQDVHTPSSSPYHKRSLDVHANIDIMNIDFELLNELVHRGINEVRAKKGASNLNPNAILDAAAKDHTDYMMRFDQLTHFQNNSNKKTVKERILSFGGSQFRMMGENVQYKGFPVRTYGRHKEIIAPSYQQAAQDLVTNWVNSPGHYRNLIDPKYQYVGTSVGWNPENSALFATQVFGS
ncbi:MAG: conjugal transfer protein TraF [Bacteroidia bacterium]|nr:conjugal transfer protein TraF [Bacteroidia bacterium]